MQACVSGLFYRKSKIELEDHHFIIVVHAPVGNVIPRRGGGGEICYKSIFLAVTDGGQHHGSQRITFVSAIISDKEFIGPFAFPVVAEGPFHVKILAGSHHSAVAGGLERKDDVVSVRSLCPGGIPRDRAGREGGLRGGGDRAGHRLSQGGQGEGCGGGFRGGRGDRCGRGPGCVGGQLGDQRGVDLLFECRDVHGWSGLRCDGSVAAGGREQADRRQQREKAFLKVHFSPYRIILRSE